MNVLTRKPTFKSWREAVRVLVPEPSGFKCNPYPGYFFGQTFIADLGMRFYASFAWPTTINAPTHCDWRALWQNMADRRQHAQGDRQSLGHFVPQTVHSGIQLAQKKNSPRFPSMAYMRGGNSNDKQRYVQSSSSWTSATLFVKVLINSNQLACQH